nr:RNA exonuclease 1 homolog isoform X2 [Equus asinus]
MKLDMLYYQNIPGPKRRITHIAKFDVPTSKEIISPFRGPVPLVSPTGILRAQQQAVQITAAVRSGQAFVAATSEQKKNALACPASQTQRKASGENSLPSNSFDLDVVLSRENAAAKPSRSHVPVKSIAASPGKAKIEEMAVYERCGSKNMYVNIAINTLKKLRNQGVSGSSNDSKTTGLKKNEKKHVKKSFSCKVLLKLCICGITWGILLKCRF